MTSKDWTISASNTGAFAGEEAVLDTQAGIDDWTLNEVKTFNFANGVAYRYWRMTITANNGHISNVSVGELDMMEMGVSSNMTIISETFTAETAPTESSAVFLHQPIAAVTLNTDILGYISRDAGTTWTLGTLVDAGSFDSTTNILTMNAVDISGQPSGTSMKYKIVTANTKEQRFHGAWLAWS